MNRRGFLKLASGLVVAAGAGQLALPEAEALSVEEIRARQLAMIEAERRRYWPGWRVSNRVTMGGTTPDYEEMLRREMMRAKKELEDCIVHGTTLPEWAGKHRMAMSSGRFCPPDDELMWNFYQDWGRALSDMQTGDRLAIRREPGNPASLTVERLLR